MPASAIETSFDGERGRLGPARAYAVEGGAVVAVSLRYADLREVPPWLAGLPRLRHLDLVGNRISSLPEWLSDLAELEVIYLDHNGLEVVPAWIGRLQQLA
jgi:Leucine-rich repeat (LRR) protein